MTTDRPITLPTDDDADVVFRLLCEHLNGTADKDAKAWMREAALTMARLSTSAAILADRAASTPAGAAERDACKEHHAALQRIGTVLGLLPGSDLHRDCVPEIARLRAAAAPVSASTPSVPTWISLPYSTPFKLWKAFKSGVKFVLHYHGGTYPVTHMKAYQHVVYVQPPGMPVKIYPDGRNCESAGDAIWLEQIATPAAPAAPVGQAEPVAFTGYLCRAWGESDRPCAEVVRDADGIRQFMVREWLGAADATDHDGTPTLPRVMAEIEGRAWDEDGQWLAEFEIGGVSVEPVCVAASTPQAARPAAQGAQPAEPSEDAARYRGLRAAATERLLRPNGLASEIAPDQRTHWVLPTLMCSGAVGGHASFDEAVDLMLQARKDAARAAQGASPSSGAEGSKP